MALNLETSVDGLRVVEAESFTSGDDVGAPRSGRVVPLGAFERRPLLSNLVPCRESGSGLGLNLVRFLTRLKSFSEGGRQFETLEPG